MTAKPAPVRSSLPPEARIHFAITEWTRLADELAEAGELAALGVGLGRLRELRRQLADLERHVEDKAIEIWPTKQTRSGRELPEKHVETDGRVLVRHSGGNDRGDWQSEELLRRLVGDQLINPDTGENLYSTLLACLPVTKSLQWRVGALREHGIEPDDWSDVKPGRATVQIVEPDHD